VSVPASDVTRLLQDWRQGDEEARERLISQVYDDLRRLARGQLARERSGHTLQPTALVHEAYLRLIDQDRVQWQNRAHFFALAATMMRRILVSHARKKHAAKRGGDAVPVTLDEALDADRPGPAVDVVALDEALEALADLDRRQARIVELRFFGGLTIRETAEVLDVSPATVKLDWQMARAWLYRELGGEEAQERPADEEPAKASRTSDP